MFIESESLEGISGTLAAGVYVSDGYNSLFTSGFCSVIMVL